VGRRPSVAFRVAELEGPFVVADVSGNGDDVWVTDGVEVIAVVRYSLTCSLCRLSDDPLEHNMTFSNSTFCPHSVFMCFVWI